MPAASTTTSWASACATRPAGSSRYGAFPLPLVGHPAEQVVGEAQKIGADLIVLGHRGKSLIERWLTGSTTKQVMGYAHCPVLVVRGSRL